MIRVKQIAVLRPLTKKSCDKFLTACYVLSCSDEASCPRHFSFIRALYAQGAGHLFRFFSMSFGDSKMDDYQEELLEYQAFELDPLEPAEDATEL
ncbi:hypothetical protein IMF27_21090 [Pseudomonas sp. PCH199]|uniref:hypothetical protein n=1 Tax=unclassified Pseudomonas TaxID=196821 RepID=UPI000FFB5F5B|nr:MULTISPECIES: hypothetical protein [unclassified Pseudomonas]MCW8277775.1 hypothetical protein [Pseudomonas sp. PCH199]